jgi:hypothetical protein
MFGLAKKERTTNETDQRAAELVKQREELERDAADRERLKGAAQAATAARERTQAELRRLLTDVDAATDASDDDIARAKGSYRAARDGEGKATAELEAHVAQHNLAARATALALEENFLEQERFAADHQADAALLVTAGAQVATVQARMLTRLREAARRWPTDEALSNGRTLRKRAALPDLSFPAGIFDLGEDVPHVGENAIVKVIWLDHILRAIGEHYPDLLPRDQADTILGRIASTKERGAPRWWPMPHNRWDVHPSRRFGS